MTWCSTLLAPPLSTQHSTMTVAMIEDFVRPIFNVPNKGLQS